MARARARPLGKVVEVAPIDVFNGLSTAPSASRLREALRHQPVCLERHLAAHALADQSGPLDASASSTARSRAPGSPREVVR